MSEYKKKTWEKGEVISAEALNNMENGIYKANEAAAKNKGIAVTAQPGQLIRVKEVDENGNPTAWDAFDKLGLENLPEGHQFGEKEVDILPETELTFVANPDMGGMVVAMCTPSAMTIEGRNYIVTFGGVEYECAPYIVDVNQHYLGNTSLMDGVDNGMPFGFMVMVDNDSFMGVVISYIGETTAKMSVKGVHPAPMMAEYAPEPVFVDLKALGLGEVNNAAKVELILSDADVKMNIEKQLHIAEKHGIIKLKFDYNVNSANILIPDSNSVGSHGGYETIPMIICGSVRYYKMSALYEDNIIHVEYNNGTFSAIARRLTLATED